MWWKLGVFVGLACVVLFSFATTDTSAFILWVVLVYGAIALWLRDYYTYHPVTHHRPVEEFFDQDRR